MGKKASVVSSQIIRFATIISDDDRDSCTEYGGFCG